MKKIYLFIISLILWNGCSHAQFISATYGLAQPGPVPKGTINAPVLKIKINTGPAPLVLDSLIWNTAGCTSFLTDVVFFSPKIFFTDTNNFFADTFQFFNQAFLSAGYLKFILPVTLHQGDNYLWLTYDVSNTATPGNCLGAFIDTLYFEGALTVNPVFVPDSFSCIVIGNVQPLATNNISALLSPINLYPNPTNGIFKIDFPFLNNKTCTLKIFDGMGNVVYQTQAPLMKENTYNFSWLANGIYTIQFTSDVSVYSTKLVKL